MVVPCTYQVFKEELAWAIKDEQLQVIIILYKTVTPLRINDFKLNIPRNYGH